MDKYKYWSTNKLLTLLKELDLGLSGTHVKDIYLQHRIEKILAHRVEGIFYKRGRNQWTKHLKSG